MDYDTITRPLPVLPSQVYDNERSRSTSSNRNSSKHRSASLNSRGAASPRIVLNELPGQKRERGRPTERRDSDGSRTASGSGSRTLSRGASKVRDKEAKDLIKVEESIKETIEVKKRVKVGARASIACGTCRKRKIRCSGEWPTCLFCKGRNLPCVFEGHPAETGGPINGSHFVVPSTNSFNFPPNFLPPTYEPVLPSVDVILDGLDHFFLHYYDTFYFLHRSSLADGITRGVAPPELIFCILAFAARTSLLVQSLPDTPNGPALASQHFANLAKFILDTPAPSAAQVGVPVVAPPEPTLLRCQCFLLLGLFECTEGIENQGWIKIGYAIRLAQVLRLGFEDEDDQANRAIEYIHSEARRRTFWSCFLVERLITDGKDRPCTLRPPTNNAWVRMPGTDLDFALNNRGIMGAKYENNPPLWSISSKQDVINGGIELQADLYGQTLRAAGLWEKVANYVGAGGRNNDRRAPWEPTSGFAALECEVLLFESTVPPQFAFNESNLVAHSLIGQGRQFGIFHLLFYCAKLVLHRDYLPFLPGMEFDASKGPIDGEPIIYGSTPAPTDYWINCLAHAFNAANTISDICFRLECLGSNIITPFAGFAALAAGTLHLHLKFWPQSYRGIGFDADRYVSQDLGLLRSLKGLYPIAASWESGFVRLHTLYQNLINGHLDINSGKVRSSVIKILRTVDEDDDKHTTAGSVSPIALRRHSSGESDFSSQAGGTGSRSNLFDLSLFGTGAMDTSSFGEFNYDSSWNNFLVSSPPPFTLSAVTSPTPNFLASPPHPSTTQW